MPDTTTNDTLTIDQALDAIAVQRFVRAYFRLGEPAKSKAGNDKVEVTLSFKYRDSWYYINHTLFGMRLADYLGEAQRLERTWATFGIGGFHPSSTHPEKYGKADILFFPSELATLFGAQTVLPVQNDEENDLSQPF